MFGLDQPSHLLILLIVLVLLFGSAKLPKLAKSLGESARIFKKETQKMHAEDDADPARSQAAPPPQLSAPAPAPQQTATASAEAQHTNQPS